LDEAVLFDHFFYPNVCPIFIAETLADLQKVARPGTTPERGVAALAEKTPVMHGGPSVHHLRMVIGDLFGNHLPMKTRQIPRGNAKMVRGPDGRTGVRYEQAPEEVAFSRWASHEFNEVERDFAKSWREELANVDLRASAKMIATLLGGNRPKSLAEAKTMAGRLLGAPDRGADRMRLALTIAGVPHGSFYQGPTSLERSWSPASR
jgi:hypothetical protein